MKKIIFSMFLFAACTLAVQAQSSGCAKACAAKSASASGCQSKVGAASVTVIPAEHQGAAAKLASLDNTIEARKTETGEVSYVRKETCGHSGSVSYVALSYDAAHNSFVNVSPTEVSTKSAAGCGPAKATAGKTGCATGASNKACCAGKAKTTTASTTEAPEGKPVKTAGGTKN